MSEQAFASRGIHSRPYEGGSNGWITPRHVLDALGEFDLDPCAHEQQPWPCAAQSFTIADDGLAQPWHGRVWLNPPYGPHTGAWLHELADHGNGIALVPARTETHWFADAVWGRADALLFLAGRLSFHRPDGSLGSGNSGHSSVLVAYGENNVPWLGMLPGFLVQNWSEVVA